MENPKEKIIKLIEEHESFREEIQQKMGRDRAVVYVVYLLNNNNVEATFQRICIIAYKLFKESFSFPEFPEFPDSRIVRNTLWHCVDKSKGWLRGSDKTKYTITEEGKEIISIFLKLIENKMNINSLPVSLQVKGVTKKEHKTKPEDMEIGLINEIKSSKAFELFKTNKDKINSIDIKKSLGGDRYTPESYLKDKLIRAVEACTMANNNEVKLYLNWIKDNWSDIMEE